MDAGAGAGAGAGADGLGRLRARRSARADGGWRMEVRDGGGRGSSQVGVKPGGPVRRAYGSSK